MSPALTVGFLSTVPPGKSYSAFSDVVSCRYNLILTGLMLKILQARQKVNHELPDVQDGFRKGKGTGDPTSTGSSKEQESSRKTFISALLTMPKSLTVWT